MDVSAVYRQPVQPTQPPKRTEESKAAERRAAQAKEADTAKAPEAKPENKRPPVVNTQGQTTGRLVNTTA